MGRRPHSSLMAHQAKDPVLSLQWLGSLLWCGFHPWPRNFHMLRVWPKNFLKNEQNNTHFPKGDIQIDGQGAHEQVLNITNHKRNANQNHTCQNCYHQKEHK